MDPDTDASRMKREIHAVPGFVSEALRERGLVGAYHARLAYQQNDYVGWITSAKRAETRQKRLDQMLDELEEGGVYMGMEWRRGEAAE